MTPWTIQSMEFSRPEYWSGQPFPSPGDLPNPGIEPRSPTSQADSLPAEPHLSVSVSQGFRLCWALCKTAVKVSLMVGGLSDSSTGGISTCEFTWLLGGLSSLRPVGLRALLTFLVPTATNKHVGSLQHDGFLHQNQPVKKSAGKVEVTICCINCGSHSAVVLPCSGG